MAIKNHFAEIVKFCSILPVFAVMPAMAIDAKTDEARLIESFSNKTNSTAIELVGDGDNAYLAENSVISNNENNGDGVGGAIYINKPTGKLTVKEGTVFSGNKSIYDGGAIGNYGTLEVTGATFEGNSAQQPGTTDWRSIGGGAISLGVDSHTNIIDSVFANNTSGYNGGAIGTRRTIEASEDGQNNSLIIANSRFEKNSATGTVTDTDNDKQAGGNGGAIANTFDTTKITDTEFIGNTASKNGGAIYNTKFYSLKDKAMSAELGGTIEMHDVRFENNFADENGGAIYNNGTLSVAENMVFSGNKAGYAGGAIYNTGTGVGTIKNSVFSNNTAEQGGAINNSATSSNVGGKLTISDSDFTNNIAWNGGAIRNQGGMTIGMSETNVLGGRFANNSSANGGAVWNGAWGKMTISGAEFAKNTTTKTSDIYNTDKTSSGQGGAITNAGTLDIADVAFIDNNAAGNGGAIANVISGGGKAIINMSGNNIFANNIAAGVANDIFNDGTLNIKSGTTTIGGGITGNGTLTVAEGATLDIGTATVSQGTLNIDGNVVASIVNSSSYGKLRGTIDAGENSTLTLNVGAVGTYDIFEDQVDMEIKYNDSLYTVTTSDDGIVVETKSVEDIAKDTNLSTGASATLVGMANSDNYVMNAVSLKAQQALEEGKTEYIETETAKLKADDKPVAHSVSTSVQNQVLALASGRMSGGAMVGRSGGDLSDADYGVWAQGLFNKSKLNGQFHGYTRGIALGADTLIDGKYTIGIGYAFNSTDVHTNARNTDIESNSIFAYGQYKPSQWYINGALNYTMSEYTEKTNVFEVGIENKYDVDAFGGQIMTGYDFASGFTPEAGIRYLHISQDDYNNGLADIKVGDTDYMTGVAGVKYAFTIESESALKLRPELRAAATYDFLSDEAIATVAMPGSVSYIVGSDRLSRFGGEFGIGLMAQYKGLEISVNYELDLHEDYTSQTGMLKFRYDF